MAASPGQSQASSLDSAEVETFRAYYALQYQRIAQHENGRLQVSNFVVAASVVALGILALPRDKVSLAAYGVPLAVGVVNVLAIAYAARSRRWVKLHQARASATLKRLSPALKALQDQTDVDAKRIDSNKDLFRSQLVQAYIHLTLAVMGVLIFLQWIFQ